jgi:hypothetical protein
VEEPHVVVQDVPASWAACADALQTLNSRNPAGLLMLVAGATDEGVRAISFWHSETDWDRFRDDCLPMLLETMEPDRQMQATSRQLVVKHLLVPQSLSQT